MNIKKIANRLAKKCNSRNPLEIAKALGFIVIHTPLSGIRGFYQYEKRCHIIYIDSTLPEETARFVCAHELGHAVLHHKLNRIYLDKCTHFVTSRYEKEADRFAVQLLYEDGDLFDLQELPISTVSVCLGVSEELAAYRMGALKQ